MNYLPFVSWGMYGATNDLERASYFVSWGLLRVLPSVVILYFRGLSRMGFSYRI